MKELKVPIIVFHSTQYSTGVGQSKSLEPNGKLGKEEAKLLSYIRRNDTFVHAIFVLSIDSGKVTRSKNQIKTIALFKKKSFKIGKHSSQPLDLETQFSL